MDNNDERQEQSNTAQTTTAASAGGAGVISTLDELLGRRNSSFSVHDEEICGDGGLWTLPSSEGGVTTTADLTSLTSSTNTAPSNTTTTTNNQYDEERGCAMRGEEQEEQEEEGDDNDNDGDDDEGANKNNEQSSRGSTSIEYIYDDDDDVDIVYHDDDDEDIQASARSGKSGFSGNSSTRQSDSARVYYNDDDESSSNRRRSGHSIEESRRSTKGEINNEEDADQSSSISPAPEVEDDNDSTSPAPPFFRATSAGGTGTGTADNNEEDGVIWATCVNYVPPSQSSGSSGSSSGTSSSSSSGSSSKTLPSYWRRNTRCLLIGALLILLIITAIIMIVFLTKKTSEDVSRIVTPPTDDDYIIFVERNFRQELELNEDRLMSEQETQRYCKQMEGYTERFSTMNDNSENNTYVGSLSLFSEGNANDDIITTCEVIDQQTVKPYSGGSDYSSEGVFVVVMRFIMIYETDVIEKKDIIETYPESFEEYVNGHKGDVTRDMINNDLPVVQARDVQPIYPPDAKPPSTSDVNVTLIADNLIHCSDHRCDPIAEVYGSSAVIINPGEYVGFLSFEVGASDKKLQASSNSSSQDLTLLEIDDVALSDDVAVFGVKGSVRVSKSMVKDHSGGVRRTLIETVLKIVPSDLNETAARLAQFGYAIDLHKDVMVVGAPNDQGGSVYIFRRNETGGWNEEQKIYGKTHSSIVFGSSVSVKEGIVAIGDHLHKRRGSVFLYQFDPSSETWEWYQAISSYEEEDCDGWFSTSLALTDDNGLMVGCPHSRALLYYTQAEDGNYTMRQKILASFTESQLGNRGQVSIDGDKMIAAAKSYSYGRIYVFKQLKDTAAPDLNNKWVEVGGSVGPDSRKYFGNWVSLSQSNLLVSSREDVHLYRLGDDLLPATTFQPSRVPTDAPTVLPSEIPTAVHTDIPSTSPTSSAKPTPLYHPSAAPSLSSAPFDRPSNLPSIRPSVTDLPTISKSPNEFATSPPTRQPTVCINNLPWYTTCALLLFYLIHTHSSYMLHVVNLFCCSHLRLLHHLNNLRYVSVPSDFLFTRCVILLFDSYTIC